MSKDCTKCSEDATRPISQNIGSSIRRGLSKNLTGTTRLCKTFKARYLKSECEQILSKHEQKYLALNNRTYEMLIGIPLGALISSIIYNQNLNSLEGIIVLILLGLFIIIGSQIGRKISFYSDGYFKDQHLLNVLRELEYVDS